MLAVDGGVVVAEAEAVAFKAKPFRRRSILLVSVCASACRRPGLCGGAKFGRLYTAGLAVVSFLSFFSSIYFGRSIPLTFSAVAAAAVVPSSLIIY